MSAGMPQWVQILIGVLPVIAFWSGWFLGCGYGRAAEHQRQQERIQRWHDVANRAFTRIRSEEGE